MAFGEIDPRRHKFWLSVEFLKIYVQKTWNNNIICQLRQGLWLHTLWKDGANTTHLRPTQRKRRNYNDAI